MQTALSAQRHTLAHRCVLSLCAEAPSFDLVFESTSTALFWFLLIAHGGLGLYHVLKGQWRGLQRWPLYLMMLGYVVVTCIDETIALIYTMQARAGTLFVAGPLDTYANQYLSR